VQRHPREARACVTPRSVDSRSRKPDPAAALWLADGRQVFVKAISAELRLLPRPAIMDRTYPPDDTSVRGCASALSAGPRRRRVTGDRAIVAVVTFPLQTAADRHETNISTVGDESAGHRRT
jgi:hypothetical protein